MSKDMPIIIPGSVEDCACPKCGAEFQLDTTSILPAETDLTISLNITEGHLIMAKTLAGVIESFAEMQEEIGKSMDLDTSVLIGGLKFEDSRIDITFRIANAVKGQVA